MNPIKLERGKPFPAFLPLPELDTAVAEFFKSSGNQLIIHLSEISAQDEWALRNGIVKFGLIEKNTAILLFFRFHDRKGQPVFTFECPFDARLIGKDVLNLPSMNTMKSRLLIEINAVDGKRILRTIRAISLPLQQSTRFLSLVIDQITNPSFQFSAMMQQNRWVGLEFGNIDFGVCGQ